MVKFIAVNLNAVTKSKFKLLKNYAFVISPLGSASLSIHYAARTVLNKISNFTDGEFEIQILNSYLIAKLSNNENFLCLSVTGLHKCW